MISQSTSNYPLPRHFNFDNLANKKKITNNPTSSSIPQQQQQNNNNNNNNNNNTSSFEFPSRKPNFFTSKILNESDEERSNNDDYDFRRYSANSLGSDASNSYKSSKSNSSNNSSSSSSNNSSSNSSTVRSNKISNASSNNSIKKKSRRRDSSEDHSEHSRSFKDRYDIKMGGLKENPLTEEEYRMKQIDLIMALRQFKEDGIPVDDSVDLSQRTPLAKLQFAYDFSMRYVTRKATFEQMQQGLTLGSQLIEMGNKFVRSKTGYGAELDGWGQSVIMNMPKFNRPLHRLAEKYSKPDSEQSPELQLAMLVGYSAFTFHFAKKMSIDPQVAMQFMDYMQNQNGGNTQGVNALPSNTPNPTGVSLNNFSTESPMGMRPPMGRNTRVPMNNNDDDDIISENTESVSVSI
jgi:hypothetical protein